MIPVRLAAATSAAALALLAALLLIGCENARRKSDAELGLNSQQAAGRRIFDISCAGCHDPYSSRKLAGPSLQGLFKRKELPSGAPANDDRVREVLTLGRGKMPAAGRYLTQQQMDDLMAYLHTL